MPIPVPNTADNDTTRLRNIETYLYNILLSPLPVLADLSVGVLNVDTTGLQLDTTGQATLDKLNASIAVTGTFYQATQPVSAASLPLPSGASTAAKQPALGVAGTASSDVISIQGISGMTALKVDGTATTQPVSGTFWQATQPVSAASLPLPSGAATSAKQDTLQTAVDAINTKTIATVERTPSITSVTTNGTVSAGARSLTFIFSSDFTGTVLTTSFNGAYDKSVDIPVPAGDTIAAVAYTVVTGNIRIVKVV